MTFVRIGQFKARPEASHQLRIIYEKEAIPAIRVGAGNARHP
jgi:hypothetical protein